MTSRPIPYGDSAWLVETGDTASAHHLARALGDAGGFRAPDGVDDVIVGLRSVVVRLDPNGDIEGCAQWLREILESFEIGETPAATADGSARSSRRVVVPVTFDGPDLASVARETGSVPDDVVTLLTSVELEVAFVGFAPGFPYLVGVPGPLADIPRRATPRRAVPAGSVALAGGFASIYPTASPGGWHLLGRTALTLFDPERPPFALLAPGDTVRFAARELGSPGPEPVTRATGDARGPLTAGPRFAEVRSPGLLSLVEDGGRRALGGAGVPRAGPCDAEAMGLVNRLLGNGDDAAALEITAVGPVLRISCDAHLAVVASAPGSVEATVDGLPVAAGSVIPVRAGQQVAVGPVHGVLRAYLGIAGGFETPLVVGSRSSDVLSGLGPGPLRTGDRLALGAPGRPRGVLAGADLEPDHDRPPVVRVLAGPHRFAASELELLAESTYTVGTDSNRIGLRLAGARRRLRAPGPVDTLGMIAGAVQVPPDGDPIVLMPDHATTGGYPVIGCVITADLPLLGRLRPGDPLRFSVVGAEEARAAHARRARADRSRVSGWFPTAS